MSKKNQNGLFNVLLNVVVPVVVLTKFSGEEHLGVLGGLLVALVFPLGYGVYEFWLARKYNFFSVLGFVSVLLTGGVGVFELGPKWLAVKEAGVPLLIGIAVFVTAQTKYSIVRLLFDQVLNHEKIDRALVAYPAKQKYELRMKRATYFMGAAFFVSATLNYVLAKVVVTSAAGTEAFNAELGRMTALSYPVIALPMLILMAISVQYLISGIMKYTDLELHDIIKT